MGVNDQDGERSTVPPHRLWGVEAVLECLSRWLSAISKLNGDRQLRAIRMRTGPMVRRKKRCRKITAFTCGKYVSRGDKI